MISLIRRPSLFVYFRFLLGKNSLDRFRIFLGNINDSWQGVVWKFKGFGVRISGFRRAMFSVTSLLVPSLNRKPKAFSDITHSDERIGMNSTLWVNCMHWSQRTLKNQAFRFHILTYLSHAQNIHTHKSVIKMDLFARVFISFTRKRFKKGNSVQNKKGEKKDLIKVRWSIKLPTRRTNKPGQVWTDRRQSFPYSDKPEKERKKI